MYESVFSTVSASSGPSIIRQAPYLDRIQDLDDAGVSQCPQFLQCVLGEGEGGSVRRDFKREYAAVGAVFLLGERSDELFKCLVRRYVRS
jgi:hypothetical protein